MKIYLVCSTANSWMNTGYGHSLLQGEMPRLLVSFVEFTKNPDQQLKVTTMNEAYMFPRATKDTPTKPGNDPSTKERWDHGTAFRHMVEDHWEEVTDPAGLESGIRRRK